MPGAALHETEFCPALGGDAGLAPAVVIGLGNPIVGDDSVGLRVAAQLARRLRGRCDVDVIRDERGGMRLMERMIGRRRAVVIDAELGKRPVGTVRVLDLTTAATRRSASAHDATLAEALDLGRALGALLPADDAVTIVAVTVVEVSVFCRHCSPPVARAIPRAEQAVLDLLELPDWRTA